MSVLFEFSQFVKNNAQNIIFMPHFVLYFPDLLSKQIITNCAFLHFYIRVPKLLHTKLLILVIYLSIKKSSLSKLNDDDINSEACISF